MSEPTARKLALSFVLAPLRALQARGGAAIGSAYAHAAAVLQTRGELLEDLAAERRYQRHAGNGTDVASLQTPSSQSLSPAE